MRCSYNTFLPTGFGFSFKGPKTVMERKICDSALQKVTAQRQLLSSLKPNLILFFLNHVHAHCLCSAASKAEDGMQTSNTSISYISCMYWLLSRLLQDARTWRPPVPGVWWYLSYLFLNNDQLDFDQVRSGIRSTSAHHLNAGSLYQVISYLKCFAWIFWGTKLVYS